MIDLNSLYMFWLAHKVGGVGAAARELQVTQPAVTQRLRALERRIGKKLYDRVGNRFVANRSGLELIERFGAAMESLPLLSMAKPLLPRLKPMESSPRVDTIVLGRRALLFPSAKPV